jgi:hypothetical protein
MAGITNRRQIAVGIGRKWAANADFGHFRTHHQPTPGNQFATQRRTVEPISAQSTPPRANEPRNTVHQPIMREREY